LQLWAVLITDISVSQSALKAVGMRC